MEFGEAIRSCLSKYAVFRGRAPRSEYWYFALFVFLVRAAAQVVLINFASFDSGESPQKFEPGAIAAFSLYAVVALGLFIPQIAVTVRRLHDLDRSGWWLGCFCLFIPIIGIGAIAMIPTIRDHTLTPAEVHVAIGVASFFVLYALTLFVFTVLKGTDGPNDYGPDPLAHLKPTPPTPPAP